MRILIAVDDSEYSRAALKLVRTLGWPAGSHALLLSVVRTDIYSFGEFYAPAAQEIEVLQREERKRAEALLAEVAKEVAGAGFSVETRVANGDPRFIICDAARQEHADVVVVGSHGRSGLKKLVLGSVASHVVTHAPCSVLVARTAAAPA